jgi:signal transduction histidine kinase/CheY-like chemotaxis protein
MTQQNGGELDALREENLRLQERLEQAEETLRAIHEGEVDAIVVTGTNGEQVFSLSGAETVYRLIVETMNEAALTVACEDGQILFANSRFADLIQRPLGQILGHRLEEFARADQHDLLASVLAKSQTTPVKDRVLLQAGGGSCVSMYLSASAVHELDRLSICIVGTDLTELEASTEMVAQLRTQKEELRRAREDTERQVHERTAELRRVVQQLEEEIVQRQKAEEVLRQQSSQLRSLASELSFVEQRERSRMAAVLHDELQQLLVGVKLQLASLLRGKDEAVSRAALETEGLINQSLAVTRSLTSELNPPLLDEGLAPALDWLARSMHERYRLAVTVTGAESVPPLPEPLQAVLFNAVRELLFNVVKHAQVQSATVRITALDRQLQIEVADAGAGFDPSQLATGRSSGGFGLFSVRERLELLGGRLEIESAPGRGTRFILVAPVDSTARPLARTKPRPEKAGRQKEPRKIRLLLVDDHTIVRQGLCQLLAAEPDFEVVGEASEGLAAIEMAKKLVPDVVVMDVNMRGMNGIEATRAIRTSLPNVQVIALSMFEEAQHGRTMRAAGALAYLSKMGPSTILIETIRSSRKEASPSPPA